MTVLALILIFGAAGASARYLVSLTHEQYGGEIREWPVGTLAVNVVASFALGLLVSGADGSEFGTARTALAVGGLGAMSTWSTVALEVARRVDAGRTARAIGYLAVSLFGGIAAAWLGLQLG